MAKFLNRLGMRYGRLTVIKNCGKNKKGRYLWLCKCDCGNEKIVVGDNLSSKKSKSCGCLKTEFLKKSGNLWGLYKDRETAILKRQYSRLKRRHLKNKMTGTFINFDLFKKIVFSECYYCGKKYSKIIEDRFAETKNSYKLSNTIIRINGIDRKDNRFGYTEENSVPCCTTCNFGKHTLNEEEFKNWIGKVYQHFAKPKLF